MHVCFVSLIKCEFEFLFLVSTCKLSFKACVYVVTQPQFWCTRSHRHITRPRATRHYNSTVVSSCLSSQCLITQSSGANSSWTTSRCQSTSRATFCRRFSTPSDSALNCWCPFVDNTTQCSPSSVSRLPRSSQSHNISGLNNIRLWKVT